MAHQADRGELWLANSDLEIVLSTVGTAAAAPLSLASAAGRLFLHMVVVVVVVVVLRSRV